MVLVKPVSGGDTSFACKLETKDGVWFLKWSNQPLAGDILEAEVRGLNVLLRERVINAPKPMGVRRVQKLAFLCLPWINTHPKTAHGQTHLAEQLAKLHQCHKHLFGLEEDNFIGSLKQSNAWHSNWADFFIRERLEPQLKLACHQGYFSPDSWTKWNKFGEKINNLFPEEPPSLLHGDLWSGNWMEDEQGAAWIIDPSIYYGHREMDLAMTRLFGGFSSEFYHVYNASYPLAPGWEERLPIAQLYYILVHVNLFGGHYVQQALAIRNKYI